MPSGPPKQEGVGLSSQMEPKAFEREVVTGRVLKAGEGSDGEGSNDELADGRKPKDQSTFAELLEAGALDQTFHVSSPLVFRVSSPGWDQVPHFFFRQGDSSSGWGCLQTSSHSTVDYSLLPTPRFALCLREGHPTAFIFS